MFAEIFLREIGLFVMGTNLLSDQRQNDAYFDNRRLFMEVMCKKRPLCGLPDLRKG